MTHTPDQSGAGSSGSSREAVKSAASDVSGTVKAKTREAVDRASTEAEDRARSAKDSVAGEIGGVSKALRSAADEMRDGSPQERAVGQFASTLADASETIRGKEIADVTRDLSDFARRNPVMFLGGAALLGFAAARFAKASERPRSSGEHDDYGDPELYTEGSDRRSVGSHTGSQGAYPAAGQASGANAPTVATATTPTAATSRDREV